MKTIQIELVLETHHRSNKGCITGRMFKQIGGFSVTYENDDIETEPVASVYGLDPKNTGSQIRAV